MTETAFIEKFRQLELSEDYAFLREAGLEYIEKLAHQIWTDYNTHDPGITILEMLCYAISDLGYRTSYPIQDILAEQTVAGSDDIKNFFSAREILPCNPVTLNDYRKLMIDVPGVKNAWLETVEEPDPQLYIDCKQSELSLDVTYKITEKNLVKMDEAGIPDSLLENLLVLKDEEYNSENSFRVVLSENLSASTPEKYIDTIVRMATPFKKVNLQGLYDVILEFEKDQRLGDLNRFEYRLIIEGEEENFEITAVLPLWDNIRETAVNPGLIEFSPLEPILNTQKYRAHIQTNDGAITEYPELQITVISEGIKTEVNRQAIQDALSSRVLDVYRKQLVTCLELVTEVLERLQSHRNLCEDFYRFRGVDIEDIGICADVEVTADADINEVQAEIYHTVAEFLAPAVRFYSIGELYEQEKSADEIFEGPILDHGFINEEDLEASRFREVIRVSDIIRIIMDVEGVVSVKKILLTNHYKGEPQTTGEPWCLNIGKNHAVRFSQKHSKFVYYKGLIPYSPSSKKVEESLKELQSLERGHRLEKGDYNLPVPGGNSRGIEDYYSIQNDFPLVYGIGKAGLPKSATSRRKTQAKQLKGYLLFFDQMLANYFSQLAHVKDLFSMNPEIGKTYFSQPLFPVPDVANPDVPNIRNLVKDFTDTIALNEDSIDLDLFKTYETEWDDFVSTYKNEYLKNIHQRDSLLEDEKTYQDRKNRFLDHLMARFCEQFTDYVMLMYSLVDKRAPEELIEDKLEFLGEYPEISRDRGKAFDYSKYEENVWDSVNVSGLQRRLSRLLGIDNFTRRRLADCLSEIAEFYQEVDEDGIDEYRFRIKDKEGKIILSSSTRYFTEDAAEQELQQVLRFGAAMEYYAPETTADDRYYFNLVDNSGEIIARRIEYFDTAEERDNEIERVAEFISKHGDCEGMHVIEHILLRPRIEDDSLLSVCVDEDCNNCSGFIDPYSFRVTVVLPYWPERFRNMDFRYFLESTLRMEAPAHVHVKICWVDQEAMNLFEETYEEWLKIMAEGTQLTPDGIAARENFREALESLRSVYPEAHLHDCMEDEGEEPLVLNRTIIGGIKEDNHE